MRRWEASTLLYGGQLCSSFSFSGVRVFWRCLVEKTHPMTGGLVPHVLHAGWCFVRLFLPSVSCPGSRLDFHLRSPPRGHRRQAEAKSS